MKLPGRGATRSIQGALVLILALFSSAAMALGLGNIRVLSKPGQPLLAEIPVISSDPGELEQARAGLAAPATFERVGLPPPQGLVSELQFQFAQDREGRAVIRVTSAAPVHVPSVGFLIEVDWGQGRLVREYSALVAAPETATAVAEPVIEAPAAAPSNLIAREPEPLSAAPAPASAAPVAAGPAPVTRSVPAPRAVAPVARAEGELGRVERGQTLSQIARELARESGTSLDQAMVALLRANPEAFIRGNVNLLKQGAVLRTPAQEELARVDAAQARAIVGEQTAQWRQARAPVPQPAIADAVDAPVNRAAAGAAASGARLEIAPAVAGGQNTAGMTTGLGAGGEGDMLANEQLQQAKEELATRDAELQELRERVGELEKLQKQQQSLIAMKDSDLAAAQQRLADAAKRESGPGTGWIWLGLGLLVLGAVGWWLSRRRKPSPLPVARSGFGPESLAAAVPLAQVDESAAPDSQQWHQEKDEELEVGADGVFEAPASEREEMFMPAWLKPVAEAEAEPVEAAVAQTPPVLLFKASQGGEQLRDMAVTPEPAAADEARWLAGDMAAVAPLNPAPAGRERLELAIAYLDLGDAETARTLLNEVATGTDPRARNEALELLARLT
ncbi:FimV/HubP family polar landmark protein [Stenotrophomonas sp. SY1]|uniref:FimV/HubP family polar landmark protein n=1 Tax=Stenotrophomonas sp. SY1 TaxID=477235 RepID=UPI001E2B04C5|nr:FimV/HubP family polar landmark protein [Stenotrophomonas sp. SY1]MCD9086576.1 fimbrial protein FimV [Stenotrophomonas sp. SY1]